MKPGKTKRAVAAALALVLVSSAASPAAAVDSVLLSALLPGLGQAQDGHYGRATAFATAAIISATGLFATQVNYARSVERYENSKRNYLYYQTAIDGGSVVKIDDVNATYASMETAWNESEDDAMWRNVFLGALIATYALNLVDILLSEPDTGERPEPTQTSLEWHGDGFRLVRTIHF
jgi:hypothetical protein